MDRALYVAAAGMRAEQVRQDQLSSDLANAATPGYKRDRTVQASFGDILLANTRTGAVVGRVGLGPYAAQTVTDIRPAAARETGEPLDFAIAGDGFFAVRTPEGTRYSRSGQFSASAAGLLTDAAGHEVLGRGGAPVRVGADGTVPVADLAVTMLTNPVKRGEGLFDGTPAGPAGAGAIKQGALEGSGVDPTRAMVDMIASLRAFEAGQKSITTIDETLGRAASQVGSATGS
ncbi:flagellar hook-basal body protein [Patulibacter sp. NPDC049589]|uniref:flagellar hook-basal body protein n=1 Tax=Patulibacter sp. NPDC049589 TaxID=3154731 RepID=UPI0034256062